MQEFIKNIFYDVSYEPDEGPLDYLHHAAECYATALKSKPNDPQMHLKLGLILEEQYYAEDLFGLKKESVSTML